MALVRERVPGGAGDHAGAGILQHVSSVEGGALWNRFERQRPRWGGFYRTPVGKVVKVIEFSEKRQVCVRYRGLYGLSWRNTWIPGDAPLTPAPELTDFPPDG